MPKSPLWYDSDTPALRAWLSGVLSPILIPDASLSSNIPLKNVINTFTSRQAISGSFGGGSPILSLTETGAAKSFFQIQRTGGTVSLWEVFLPSGSTDFRFNYNAGADLFILNTAGDLSVARNLIPLGGQIKFPATQIASADVNTLDDYEEGSFTPTDGSGAGLTFTVYGTPSYVKIGQAVTFSCNIQWPVTASGANTVIGGLPFTNGPTQVAAPPGLNTTGIAGGCFVEANVAQAFLYNVATGARLTNVQLSNAFWFFSGIYKAAA